MKRFMYFSIAVLCLMISALLGSHLLSTDANAGFVISETGIIAMNGAGYLLDENGEVWLPPTMADGVGQWIRAPEYDPPVPPQDIKFWNGGVLITKQNVAWVWPWQNAGVWPGGAIPTSPETWGSVKGKYEGKK